MNLEDVFIMCDDFQSEQKHLQLVFLFHDSNIDSCYEYVIDFHTGMPFKDFKKFMFAVAKKMETTSPTKCSKEV